MAPVSIGIMGGTFDPVHNGHIAVAGEVRMRLGLGCVVFVPAGRPWLKSQQPVTPAAHRFEMVRRAISPYPYFRISSIEIDRAGPTYTIDTITELRAEFESGDQFYFILGRDSLAQLPRWRDADRLIRLCRLVAVPRPGYALPDFEYLERQLPGISKSVTLVDVPEVDVSATRIREMVACGEPITDLVPEPVERYIRENRLYVTAETTAR